MVNNDKPYILIVDDIEENLILLEESLKSFDADIIKATSGKNALSVVENSTPALALIDVMMPGMNGYQLARKILEDKHRDIFPIIFITAINQNQADILEGYDSGAIDFIFKPINIHVLQNKVSWFLKLNREKQKTATLRKKAVEKLKQNSSNPILPQNENEIQKLIHEIQVHQIELEIQNDELRRAWLEVKETQNRFTDLYEFAPVIYFTTNKNGIIEQANLTASGLLGIERIKMIKKNFFDFVIKEDQEQIYFFFKNVYEKKSPVSCELRMQKQDGSIFWAILNGKLNINEYSKVEEIRINVSDISNLKKIELDLSETQKNLVDAQRLSHIGSWTYNPITQKPVWTEEMFRIWGLDPDKGAPDYSEHRKYIHPDDFPRLDAAVQNAVEHGDPYEMELRICRPDGSTRTVITFCEPVLDDSGKVINLIGTNQDITERKQAEEEIAQTHKQLREYATRLQQIREEERTSIAREIHDEFGQVLTALKMNLTILGNEVKNPGKRLKRAEIIDEVNNMNKIIDNTVHHVRVFTNKLRPDVLDNFGLIEALDAHIEEFRELYNLKCNFLKPDEIEISSDKSIAIYRIVQEALTNIKRHANATEINIVIFKKNNFLNVIIEDNGNGIVQKQSGKTKKFGIIGMKERAYICDGKLEITSEPGKGTKIELTIPLIKND